LERFPTIANPKYRSSAVVTLRRQCDVSGTIIKSQTPRKRRSELKCRHGKARSGAKALVAKNELPGIEGFCESTGGAGFHAANAHEPEKSVLGEPLLIALRTKALHQEAHFARRGLRVQRDKEIGSSKVAIVLGNFVFQNEMIPPGVPNELIEDAVVLMQVMTGMGENDVWRKQLFEFFKIVFNFSEDRGEVAVAKIFDENVILCGALEKKRGTAASFPFALCSGAEHYPKEFKFAVSSNQLKNGAAAANFYVIAMRAEAQNLEGAVLFGG